MKRLVFALAFVCVLLVAALVVVMMENNRLKIEVRDLTYFTSPERMKRRLTVSIDVRENYIFAEASNGSATVEMKRDILEFGLVRLEKPQ